MTTVAALKAKSKVFVGAESQGTSGGTIEHVHSKVFPFGEYIAACSGTLRLQNILQHCCEPPSVPGEDISLEEHLVKNWISELRECMSSNGYKENENSAERFSGIFILAYKNQFCVIEGNFAVMTPTEKYSAIGSGTDQALGALYYAVNSKSRAKPPKEIVRLAVAAACHHDLYSSGEITVLST